MGITVPATTVLIYDDTVNTNHAAAPGTHTDAEISALAAASFTDFGTAPKNYGANLTIQLGDAPGTAFTSLTITDDAITCLAGKQLTALASAAANTWLKIGTKVGSGNVASGKRGAKIRGGSGISLPCNLEIYGAYLESETGGVTLGANAAVTKIDIQNTLIRAATVNQIGTGGIFIANLYNVDFIADNTNATVVTNFFVKRAERLTFTATSPIGFMLWNSSITPEVRETAFFGTPTADIRMTSTPAGIGGNAKFVKHRWSGNAPRFPNNTFLTTDPNGGAWEYGVGSFSLQHESTHAAVPGLMVRLTDALGLQVLDWTASDAYGEVHFGDSINTIYGDAVHVLDYYRDTTKANNYYWRQRGPFLLEVRDPTGKYRDVNHTYSWAQGADTYGPLLRNMEGEVIEVGPPGGLVISGIGLPGAGELRLETTIPEAI